MISTNISRSCWTSRQRCSAILWQPRAKSRRRELEMYWRWKITREWPSTTTFSKTSSPYIRTPASRSALSIRINSMWVWPTLQSLHTRTLPPAARFCSVFPEESINNWGSRLPPVWRGRPQSAQSNNRGYFYGLHGEPWLLHTCICPLVSRLSQSSESVALLKRIDNMTLTNHHWPLSLPWTFVWLFWPKYCQLKEGSTELKLELVDVGGQRGERRRWIHCFEGVDAGGNCVCNKADIPRFYPSIFSYMSCVVCS